MLSRVLRGRRLLLTAAVAGAGALALLGAPAGQADPSANATILVKFQPGVDGSATVTNHGDVPTTTAETGVVLVGLKPGETVGQGLMDYGASPDVVYAEPNATYTGALEAPNDPSFSSQWALSRIHALDGWAKSPNSYGASGGPVIAVVDSGIDSTNPDLADGRVLTGSGANCLSGTCVADPASDDNGHGTSVAGVLDASTNNSVGIAGEAFSSPVLPVKVLDSSGFGSAETIAAGIIWAADRGARVVNLSIAGPFSQTICDAVTYATSAGALVVAAAGNNGSSAATYPAACPGAIGVAATDSSDSVPYWSNYGSPNVFVSAPGVSVLTTARGGGYTTVDGTSIAAPYVSGLAALLFSQDPSLTPVAVKTIIAKTADKVGSGSYGADPYSTCDTCTWNSLYGYGRIDVANALYYPDSPPPSFSLSASSAATTVGQGKTTSLPVSVGSNFGYGGNVNLSVSGLPAGATASFSSSSVAAPGSSQLTVTADSSTPLGDYTLTITGSDGTITQTSTVTLTVAMPDFTISASPATATVGQGKTKSLSVSVGSNFGYGGNVNLSVSGLPADATASFSSSSVTAPASSQLTVTAASTTPLGDYTLTITASDGTITHTSTVTLTVVIPDFTISASPASATVPRGQSTTYALSLGSVGGFSGAATLSVTGLPTYATGTFSLSSTALPGSSTLTVKTATTTPAGTYTLTIKGTSGTVVHTTTVTITVVIPDFSVSASPGSATLLTGQTATYAVAVNAVNGFTGNIALTVTGYPSGATVSMSPTSVAAGGTSTLTVKPAATTLGGTYTLTITGTSSAKVVRTAKVTLVFLAPDFTVSSSQTSATVLQGQSATYPVSVDVLRGFTGTIALTVSGYPSGATVSYLPSSVAAPGSSTLTVQTTATMAVGTYTLTITGTSSTKLVRTTKVTLVVNPVGDFLMTASAGTINVTRGSSALPYAYLNAQNGFYCNVYFSTSGLPAGMTATWGKTYLLVYGTSRLSVSVKLAATTATVPGTYTVNLVGTCGPIVHTAPLSVVVT